MMIPKTWASSLALITREYLPPMKEEEELLVVVTSPLLSTLKTLGRWE